MLKSANWTSVEKVIYKLVLLMLVYFFIRLGFIFYNLPYFKTQYFYISWQNVGPILLSGLQFDVITILFLNSPLFILEISPLFSNRRPFINYIFLCFFLIINGLSIFVSIADTIYFSHSLKRSTGAIVGLLDGFYSMLFTYLIQYWSAFFVFILVIFFLVFFYRRIERMAAPIFPSIYRIFPFICCLPVYLYLISKISNPLPKDINSAVTNTPYVLINSFFNDPLFFNDKKLRNYTYFDPDSANIHSNLRKNYFSALKQESKCNIVVVILEGLGNEYVGFLNNGAGVTPFLDSLCTRSLVFPNFFSNGTRSIEGIPAILAGIPTLMREPFLTSRYKNNKFDGLATVLGRFGYQSAFFHGGINGIYGFDFFARRAGFTQYFGKNEFNNDRYFDGAWGIQDDKFLVFSAEKIGELREPFVSAIFSLSSHHPFRLPKDYVPDSLFSQETIVQSSMRYADYSLRMFFEQAKRARWFGNTVFVITADHTALTDIHSISTYKSDVGRFRVPLIIYDARNPIAKVDRSIVQQIDILPTVIDLTNLNTELVILGHSAFDSRAGRFAFQFVDNSYQVIDSSFVLQFDGDRVISIYDYKQDPLLRDNLVGKQSGVFNGTLHALKRVIQDYNLSLNSDLLSLTKR